MVTVLLFCSTLKKSRNASKPSEHTPDGEKMSKRLGGIIDCKDKTSLWHLIGVPDGSGVRQQYHVGEKPTVILYAYYIRALIPMQGL